MVCTYCEDEFQGRKYWHPQLHDYICKQCKEEMEKREAHIGKPYARSNNT